MLLFCFGFNRFVDGFSPFQDQLFKIFVTLVQQKNYKFPRRSLVADDNSSDTQSLAFFNRTEASQSDALGPLASQTDHKDSEEESLEFYRLSEKVAKTVYLSRVKRGWLDKEEEEEEEERESAHYANLLRYTTTPPEAGSPKLL